VEQVKKSDILKYAKNEYLAAMLAAKVARRLHSMEPAERPDPKAKVTSLALKLITDGKVEYKFDAPEVEPGEHVVRSHKD
jgi:DNA-directed RNA polymerase subunit K/omega